MNHEQLRAVALAAKVMDHNESGNWYGPTASVIDYPKDMRFIAAVSPDVVLDLLNAYEDTEGMLVYWLKRNKELLAENQELREALEAIQVVVEDSPVKTYQRMEDIAKAALGETK